MIRRRWSWAALLVALAWTVAQPDWSAWASVRQVPAHHDCPCHGTAGCCCLTATKKTEPADYCHLNRTAGQTASCQWRSAGCHDSATLIAQAPLRDAVIPSLMSSHVDGPSRRRVHTAHPPTATDAVREPPFIPPESLA